MYRAGRTVGPTSGNVSRPASPWVTYSVWYPLGTIDNGCLTITFNVIMGVVASATSEIL